jgi:hypothetical protein
MWFRPKPLGVSRFQVFPWQGQPPSPRSPSHSAMKTENWFQLRIVGVTAIREPGFCRASSIAERSRAGRWPFCLRGCRSCEHGPSKCLRTQQGSSRAADAPVSQDQDTGVSLLRYGPASAGRGSGCSSGATSRCGQ